MTPDEILKGLYDETLVGNAPTVLELTNQGIADGMNPETLLFEALIPSLEEVGARFERGDYLLFGKESTGVGPETHAWVENTFGANHALRIPMPASDGVRSLNLATAVAISAYEGLRQVDASSAQAS